MSSYQPVWPEFELGWRVVVGSVIGFIGAGMGSAGGVGGGGIYVPMLTLIIGFDPKSAAAISKCMIMGAAGSTVYYNMKQKHPTLDSLPLIDYDLALLFQPMLMLGICIGVAFNLIFADWMITLLLIILFIVTSMKAIFRGLDTWKKESLVKREATTILESEIEKSSTQVTLQLTSVSEAKQGNCKVAAGGETDEETTQFLKDDSNNGHCKGIYLPPALSREYWVLYNIRWTELSILVLVWFAFFFLQIMKMHVVTCSAQYWKLNLLQVPIAVSVSLFEATSLYRGRRVIASKGKDMPTWKIHQLLLYCCCGVLAGTIVGTLGLGGGFILTPLFLEIGIPPQVASATATFSMAFSSSMSVVQYYILKRFPVPYAAYLFVVTIVAALTAQHVMSKVIAFLGRASIIIFILALTILLSAFCLGGVGISNMIQKLENHEYMGFDSLCH